MKRALGFGKPALLNDEIDESSAPRPAGELDFFEVESLGAAGGGGGGGALIFRPQFFLLLLCVLVLCFEKK